MMDTLRADFARVPELLALEPPPQPEPREAEQVVPEPELVRDVVDEPAPPEPEQEPERQAVPADSQLGLF